MGPKSVRRCIFTIRPSDFFPNRMQTRMRKTDIFYAYAYLPFEMHVEIRFEIPFDIQVASGLRNLQFGLRLWILEGQFGTMLEHARGSPPTQSRGASPPDPSQNLCVCTWKRFFRFLT